MLKKSLKKDTNIYQNRVKLLRLFEYIYTLKPKQAD